MKFLLIASFFIFNSFCFANSNIEDILNEKDLSHEKQELLINFLEGIEEAEKKSDINNGPMSCTTVCYPCCYVQPRCQTRCE